MLRKTTAMIFMLVMAMLITLKHPVLGYCLCLDSYFTGDCVCQVEKSQSTHSSVGNDNSTANGKSDSPCPTCCATSEIAECSSNSITDGNQDAPVESTPCDDCTEHFNIDVGDYVWHSSDKVPLNTEMVVAIPYNFAVQELKIPSGSFYSPMSIRGDPPPGLHNTDIPLYLRLSVLRL